MIENKPKRCKAAYRSQYQRCVKPRHRRLRCEPLEQRRMLSTVIPDAFATAENTVLAADVSTNDSQVEVCFLVTSPEHGALDFHSNGSFVYTPDADFTGTDSFTYSDELDHSYPANVTITVVPAGSPPVAIDDNYTAILWLTENELEITCDVLANDRNVADGNLPSIVEPPRGGSAIVDVDGTVSYRYLVAEIYELRPIIDRFTYSIEDPLGTTSTATVEVYFLTPKLDVLFWAQDDFFTTDEDFTISGDVAANDAWHGNPFSVSLVSSPGHGQLSLFDDGSFLYEPDSDYSGLDIFTYEAADDYGSSDQATVTITINAVADPPINHIPTAQIVAENGSLEFSSATGNAIVITDADPDAGENEIQVTLDTDNGSLNPADMTGLSQIIEDIDGTFFQFTGRLVGVNAALDGLTFTPAPGFVGECYLQISTNDLGNGGSADPLIDTDTLVITVTSASHPGDANFDRVTDLSDFNIWNAHKFTDGTDWTSGDFNFDGRTDLSDFNIWNAHKFTSAPAPDPVPLAAAHDNALTVSDSQDALLTRLASSWHSGTYTPPSEAGNPAKAAVDKLLATYWP